MVLPSGLKRIGAYAFGDNRGFIGNLTLPEGIDIIGDHAFINNASITGVFIPGSVTTVGEGAFNGCGKVETLELSEGIQKVEWYAFANCVSLETVRLPDSITTLGGRVFYGCSKLSSVNYPLSLETILDYGNDGPFSGCTKLKRIDIPEGVSDIPASVFHTTSNLITITLPSTLKTIGDSAFNGCSGLVDISIPDSVCVIGNFAFSNCTGIKNIALPNSLNNISPWAFSGCTQLASVELPTTLKQIGNYTFYGCVSLSAIELPNSIENIGCGAFGNCTSMESIYLPNSIKVLYHDSFIGCSNLSKVNYPINWSTHFYEPRSPFNNCNKLDSIIIPEGVEMIPEYAFAHTQLRVVYVPSSVKTIGQDAFSDCTDELVIYGASGSFAEEYAQENGLAFSSDRIQDTDYGETDVTVQLHALTPDGVGIAGARIQVLNNTNGDVLAEAVTDNSGTAVISGLQRQRAYCFTCTHEMFGFDKVYRSFEKTPIDIAFTASDALDEYLCPGAFSWNVPKEGGTLTIPVASTGMWSAQSASDWAVLSLASGQSGDSVVAVVSANAGGFRSGEITLSMGSIIQRVYIQQAGELGDRPQNPVITWPSADNVKVSYGNITVCWDAVDGAESYIVSLRDLDTNRLLIHHQAMNGQTQAVLETDYFDDGHSYRVAVGALPPGAASTDSCVSWCERIFTVDQYVSTEPIVFEGMVYEIRDAGTAYQMRALSAEAMTRAAETITFQGAQNCTVSVYALDVSDNTWKLLRTQETDSQGQYKVTIGDSWSNGQEFRLLFNHKEHYFIGSVERIIHGAQPGQNRVTDIYCYSAELEAIIEAWRNVGGYNTKGLRNGLFAEYFQYSDKNNAFTAENKRNEGAADQINYSWVDTSKGLDGGISYYCLGVRNFNGSQSANIQPSSVNYVPFKFAARFNGYVKLKGSGDANIPIGYQFRLRGDDGVRLDLELPGEPFDTASKWKSGGENIAVSDISSRAFLNGTTLKVRIEYYNKSDGGNANLIFEYSTDKGASWKAVPADWLFMGERTVSLLGTNERSLSVNYVAKLAKSRKAIMEYNDQLFSNILCDLAGWSIDSGMNAYNISSLFSDVVLNNTQKAARFFGQNLGKTVAKAVYRSLFNSICGIENEEEVWDAIISKVKSEYGISFDSAYDAVDGTFSSIGTFMEFSAALKDNPNSGGSVAFLQRSILDNIQLYTTGDLRDLDSSAATVQAGYKGLFDPAFERREEVEADVIKLDSGVMSIWSFVNKGKEILSTLFSNENANAQRARYSLMYAEQRGKPEIYEACGAICEFDGGTALMDYWLSPCDTRADYENQLNRYTNTSINRLAAAVQGVQLDSILYMELLKVTLDATYNYYKSFIKAIK